VWSPPSSGVRFTLKRKAKFPITKPCTSAACAGLSVRLPLANLRVLRGLHDIAPR
jgi:hypothetical protein